MTRIATDQGEKESRKSVPICAIGGSKQTEVKQEKALAGFGPTGHSGIHIQSLVTIPFRAPRFTPCDSSTIARK
jgi:hypothetical protein